ncbi:unnamed protein product [Enterobius vermicularis]|uniref:BHLH domain-containing protein n=1 Tax=Enterobius vermicularis TaxID=51028 RepID=A0A0N4UUJ3_ENTVE|nr:unnamed protein product [Enterobius vermicularis]
MAEPLVQCSNHPSKTLRRKSLQRHIRQIKHLVAKRIPSSSSDQKLSTLETLEKTVEILKSTPVYSADGANVSPAHSWSDTPIDGATNFSEDCWMPPTDFANRHLFSVKISLPDGNIIDYRNNSNNCHCNLVNLEVGGCFFEVISDYGKQALLTSAFAKAARKRILTRISGTSGNSYNKNDSDGIDGDSSDDVGGAGDC